MGKIKLPTRIQPVRRERHTPHIPTLADRKRMLVEVVQLCTEPRTIAELEAVMIEHAARALAN